MNIIKKIGTQRAMTIIILIGSVIIVGLLTIMISVGYFIFHTTYALIQVLIGVSTITYLGITAYVVTQKRTKLAAWMLMLLYAFIAVSILHFWGINAPIGLLVLGFVIILSGVMLGARYINWVTLGVISLLILLQVATVFGINEPDRTILDDASTIYDVVGYVIIFSIFALLAWLSGGQMEYALLRALEAERALKIEKDSLALRLEEQTRNLREAQIQEMRHLYSFAELGQLTTVILHELANHLTILTLDIDTIKDRHHNSIAICHAKESISYIDAIIEKVREQIKDSDNVQRFDVTKTLKETVLHLKKKLPTSNIIVKVEGNESHKHNPVFGDPLRLAQALIILVTNAYQARLENTNSKIIIEVSQSKHSIHLTVKDFGSGIPHDLRPTLFEPHKSNKGDGLGIGLYLTKQIIETHFKGRIRLSQTKHTQFNIDLPKSK